MQSAIHVQHACRVTRDVVVRPASLKRSIRTLQPALCGAVHYPAPLLEKPRSYRSLETPQTRSLSELNNCLQDCRLSRPQSRLHRIVFTVSSPYRLQRIVSTVSSPPYRLRRIAFWLPAPSHLVPPRRYIYSTTSHSPDVLYTLLRREGWPLPPITSGRADSMAISRMS